MPVGQGDRAAWRSGDCQPMDVARATCGAGRGCGNAGTHGGVGAVVTPGVRDAPGAVDEIQQTVRLGAQSLKRSERTTSASGSLRQPRGFAPIVTMIAASRTSGQSRCPQSSTNPGAPSIRQNLQNPCHRPFAHIVHNRYHRTSCCASCSRMCGSSDRDDWAVSHDSANEARESCCAGSTDETQCIGCSG